MKRVGLYGWCFLVWATVGFGQAEKRPLTVDDLAAWERITDKKISDDGKWIAVRQAPWQGDPSVLLYDVAGKVEQSIPLGTRMDFSPSSDYLVVSVVPFKAETDSLKLRKTKKEEMPVDKLVLHRMKDRRQEVIDSVRTYKLAGTTDWIAYQRGTKKDSTLYVRSLDGSAVFEFPFVTAYGFAEKGEILYYLSQPAHDSLPGGLYTFSTGQQKSVPRKEGKGVYKQVTFDKTGDRLAFLFCEEKDSAAYAYELYLAEQGKVARKVADKHLVGMLEGWFISPEGRLGFGETTEYIYLGIAPVPREKDTTLLAENRPDVHVWTWNEGVQYTQQDHNRNTDLKRTYLAVLHLPDSMITGLASPEIPQIITNPGRDAATVLGVTSKPYDVDRMWRGREQVNLYTIDVKTGWKELIRYGLFGRPQLSPEGNYAVWYSPADSSWYTYFMDLKKEFRLTTPRDFIAWNEENDVPDFPAAYGIAGWTMHDESLLIYDRYDIWKFDPQGRHEPVNLTGNGRTTRTRYRLEKLDPEERGLDPEGTYLVSSFDETTKGTGFYSMSLRKPDIPKQLLAGEFLLKSPVKAKRADRIIFTRETYTQYPDIWSCDLTFKKPVQITRQMHQQEPFRWGTAELVNWTSLNGIPLQGIVYKPADFDPAKQYPLIVNFYERNSETLYSYRMPEPHRSTIDYHLYNSHGYIVFNPDIVYTEGYPGESCYAAVMPGIDRLVAEGFINEKAIGAQGHSWGGYQVAYLATQTNRFKAIESGAPVVNMFSAYGGIRGGSGMNRSFQYEYGQSRIGGSIWSVPNLYYENSPLFNMDQVWTPILIMHNDADGHVPWHLGVEYFVALRRLNKPVWLLNYTGEPHWPEKMANKVDFQRRMFQFFEHYLNGKPMPRWMRDGIPAVDRDVDLGY